VLPLTRARFAIRAILTLLFLVAWGEPVAMLHHCRVHDEGVHAATHSAAHEMEAGADADDDTPLCSCVGTSCPTTVAVVTPAAPLGWRVVLVDRDAAPPQVATHARRDAAPRLLPFANGPPAA
jgi:hypothetical protein